MSPTVFSFVDDEEPGPFNVFQARRALPAFLCTLSIWFLAVLEMMPQTNDSTPSAQSLPIDTLPVWYLLFLQPCGIADACSLCDPLWPLILFVELLPSHPHLVFAWSIIPKCCALDLSLVKYVPFVWWPHASYFSNASSLLLQFILLNSNPAVCVGLTAFPSIASFAKVIWVLLIPWYKSLMKILKSARSGISVVQCNAYGMSWSVILRYWSSQDRHGVNRELFYWYAMTWERWSEVMSNCPGLGRSEHLLP